QKVRVALHQQVIFERAGLALIGVAGDVARGNFLVDELPLHPGRKAGTATPAEARRLDHLDDLFGLLRQRLLQRVVALVLEIEVQRAGVGFSNVLGKFWLHVYFSSLPALPQLTLMPRSGVTLSRPLDDVMAAAQRRLAARLEIVEQLADPFRR